MGSYGHGRCCVGYPMRVGDIAWDPMGVGDIGFTFMGYHGVPWIYYVRDATSSGCTQIILCVVTTVVCI